MAAIDKTYTNKWEEYCEYRDWAMGQKFVCPNGDIIRPIDYLFRLDKVDFPEVTFENSPMEVELVIKK